MRKSVKQLPDKPSELIRLAIADLRKCEWSGDLSVNFGCLLARSVMVQTLKMDPKRLFAKPGLVGEDCREKIYALEAIQLGLFSKAFQFLHVKPPVEYSELPKPRTYALYPEAFKQDCLDIADQLEAAGH